MGLRRAAADAHKTVVEPSSGPLTVALEVGLSDTRHEGDILWQPGSYGRAAPQIHISTAAPR